MIESLHTPEEITAISNAAHVAEGVVLLVFAAIIIGQGFGYLQKARQRYLVPYLALFASLLLVGFLFFDHLHELPQAWQWITTDMQQQQHLMIAVVLGIASIAALIGMKLKQKWLEFSLPLAFAVIGVIFIIHPQHGTDEEAARALLIHRVAGTSLIFAGLTQAIGLLRTQWRKWLAVATGIFLILSAVLFMGYREPAVSHEEMNHESNGSIQSQSTYSLNLIKGISYEVGKPSEFVFDIRDENGTILKDFDTVHEKQMHLIVVRKDRTNFQHVHPTLDQTTGTFTLADFTFPTNGEYRVFADFTPTYAQKDERGEKLPVTPFKDVVAGTASYAAQDIGADKLTSDINGFSTNLSLMGDDTVSPQPYEDVPLMLGADINKGGTSFKNLQPYLGALGHMVVLGPNLEYIHAHATTEDTANQTGMVSFMVTFPDPGKYKIYLQTQANGQVNTTDYTYTIKSLPSADTNNNNSMPSMEHSGH